MMIRELNAHFDSSSSYFTKNGKKFFYEEGIGAYEYLMGALSGCFTSTLKDILQEMNIQTQSIDLHTYGVKRESIPSTLKDTYIDITIRAVNRKRDEENIRKAVIRTQENCSMYQTIKCVSAMHVTAEVL